MRALDQPGDVGDDERALARQPDDAQVRDQRRERVVGDLGARRGDARDERRLADVGEAEQADVGEQLELEAQRRAPRRACPARPCAAPGRSRSRSGCCRARPCRPGRRRPLAVRAQVGDQLARRVVEHLRAGRDAQHEVFAAAAVLVLVGARRRPTARRTRAGSGSRAASTAPRRRPARRDRRRRRRRPTVRPWGRTSRAGTRPRRCRRRPPSRGSSLRRRSAWARSRSRRPDAADAARPRAGDDAGDRARAGAARTSPCRRQREEREVAAHADVRARVDHGADLANQDVAREHDLAGVALDAAALRCESRPLRELP